MSQKITRLLMAVAAAIVLVNCRQQPAGNSDQAAAANNTANLSVAHSTGAKSAPVNPASLAPVPGEVLNTEIKTLEGKSLRLSDYAGKVVVLDLWATWCPPCRKEIPHLIELGNEYKNRGVEVIGITTENPEQDSETVRDFAREFGINYKLGWASREVALGVLEMSGRDTIPQTLIITRDGRVIKHIIGFDPNRTPKSMRDAIEQAVSL